MNAVTTNQTTKRQKELPDVLAYLQRATDRTSVAIVAIFVLTLAGCQPLVGVWSSGWRLPPATMLDRVVPGAGHDDSHGNDSHGPDSASFGYRSVLAAQEGWVRSVRRPGRDQPEPSWRWRHQGLEDLLSRPDPSRLAFRMAMLDKDPAVATAAAIALVRLGDGSGAKKLAAAVRAPGLQTPLRSAAAEALGAVDKPSPVKLLRELIDQYGNFKRDARSGYHAGLHTELIRSLARHVDPADDKRLLDALHSPAADVRLEAVTAHAAGRKGSLADEAAELATDPDYRVRCVAIRGLTRRRHPKARQYLLDGLRDQKFQVRVAAIAALGELGGPDADKLLQEMLEDRSDRIRAAAVEALASLGADRAVFAAAEDEAWRVRAAVAKTLRQYPDPKGAALARKLLDDPGIEVQSQVIAAVAEWPLELAGPILLGAMGKTGFMTRKTAAGQLADRWPPAEKFPFSAPQDRRDKLLNELDHQFRRQFGAVRQAISGSTVKPTGQPFKTVPPEKTAYAERLLKNLSDPRLATADRQQLLGELSVLGPDLAEVLGPIALDRQQILPEEIYTEVLPRQSRVFEELDRLRGKELASRRRAAARLAEFAAEEPLGRLALSRLVSLVTQEPDQLVLRSALEAVADDGSEPSIRLAYAAIGHRSPEVRRRACEHLMAHPDPRHVPVLLPVLKDASDSVVQAAVRALAATGRLDDTRPLERLLVTGSEPLRVEVAAALVRLGNQSGNQELMRLALSGNKTVRLRVAEVMGELANPLFTPALIRLLDDRMSIRRAALASLPKTVGHDVAQAAHRTPSNTSQQIDLWKRWFEHRR